MTRNKKLGAFRSKARSLAMGALLANYCLATSGVSGLILIAANTAAQAKAGGGSGGHSSSGHSSSGHGGNAHSGGPGGTGAPGTVGNNGAGPSGVGRPAPAPAEEGGHGGHAPCPSAECP